LKVLHVITGLNDGGAEAVLYRLCTSDKSNQHIVFSMMDEGKYGPALKDAGIKVKCLNMRPGRVSLFGLWKLFVFLRKHKPDVVQTWMYHADLIGGIISRLAGVKNIIWGVHHTNLEPGKSKRNTIVVAKLNAFISNFVPRKIVYCAQKSREIQESIGFNNSKGVVVHNGYNVADFQPNENLSMEFKSEMLLKNDDILLGHVGRFNPQKDYKNLINALALVSKQFDAFKAVFVGTNLDKNNHELVTQIESKNLLDHVELIGRREDIPKVMNAYSLFLLSSSSEAFPNVLNEAMACGTPCVTTDVGDAAVIVGDTGWIVPPKNPQALADAITKAIEEIKTNDESWLQRKEACRKRIVNKFSIEKMIESYNRVWFG